MSGVEMMLRSESLRRKGGCTSGNVLKNLAYFEIGAWSIGRTLTGGRNLKVIRLEEVLNRYGAFSKIRRESMRWNFGL